MPEVTTKSAREGFALNPARGVVRPVDFGLFSDEQFVSQLIYFGESIVVVASSVPAGGVGPKPHLHPVDQIFYSILGELELDLGVEHYAMRPGSMAFIPAGTPHKHHNPTAEREVHLELIVPGVHPGATYYTRLEADHVWTAGGTVHALEPKKWREGAKGFWMQWFLDPSNSWTPATSGGADNVGFYVARVEPGSGRSGMHIHQFDQFYYILDGKMHVTVGLDEYEAGPHSVVVLPAGVPHRNRNLGPATETHIAINVPAPTHANTKETPWDDDVAVERTARLDH